MADLADAYRGLLEARGNRNAGKLRIVFAFWLRNVRVGLSYGREMPAKCLNLFTYFCQADDIDFNHARDEGPQPLPSLPKRIAWRMLSLLPLPRGVYPGGRLRFGDGILANLTC